MSASPRGFRDATLRTTRGKPRYWLWPAWGFLCLVLVFLYLPLAVTILYSFSESELQVFPIESFSLKWYGALLDDAEIIGALVRSAQLALAVAGMSCVLGTMFALGLARRSFPGRFLLQALTAVPALLPGVVLGLGLALSFRSLGLEAGKLAIIIGHSSFATPIVMFVILQRLETLDPSLEQASYDLGAGRMRTFVRVTLPQIASALLGVALLAFTLSFDEIIVTFFLVGADPTLPLYVFTQLRFGFTPEINAIFALISGTALVVIFVATRLIRRPATIRVRRMSAMGEDDESVAMTAAGS